MPSEVQGHREHGDTAVDWATAIATEWMLLLRASLPRSSKLPSHLVLGLSACMQARSTAAHISWGVLEPVSCGRAAADCCCAPKALLAVAQSGSTRVIALALPLLRPLLQPQLSTSDVHHASPISERRGVVTGWPSGVYSSGAPLNCASRHSQCEHELVVVAGAR